MIQGSERVVELRAEQPRSVAVITGAGSTQGIGLACARAIGAAGSALMICATTDRIHLRAQELRAEGLTVEAFVGDLTDSARATELITRTLTRFARLDILINNAGMSATGSATIAATAAELSDQDWWASLDRNLSSTFFTSRAALAPMLAAGYGRIVNIGSVSGPVVAFAGDAGYHAAKAGLLGLTRSIAVDVADRGITVNAVAPGWIATESSSPHELRMGAASPVGRPGRTGEVAATVAHLASPAASYLTGQLIIIDGGNSIREERGR